MYQQSSSKPNSITINHVLLSQHSVCLSFNIIVIITIIRLHFLDMSHARTGTGMIHKESLNLNPHNLLFRN